MAGYFQKFPKMAVNVWKWLEMAGNGDDNGMMKNLMGCPYDSFDCFCILMFCLSFRFSLILTV